MLRRFTREGRARPRHGRLRRRRAAHRRHDAGRARRCWRAATRGPGPLADPGDLRRRRGCCWSAFVLVERRADEPVLPLWVFRRRAAADDQRALAARSAGVILWPVVLRADLGQDVIGAVGDRERLRARRADPRLAGGRGAVGPALPQHRVPGDRPARGRARRRRLAGARADGPGRVAVARGARLPADRLRDGLGRRTRPGRRAVQRRLGQRGVATATNMFSRSVGSAIGVAVFGAIVNAGRRRPPDRGDAGRPGCTGCSSGSWC